MMPTNKTTLKSTKPQYSIHLCRCDTEESFETLKGCFCCTDWSIFQYLELNEATETITNYIKFCIDTVVPKKQIRPYANKMPYLTCDVKTIINNKRLAFKNKDKAAVATAQKEVNTILRNAREKQHEHLKRRFISMDNKKV